MTSTLGFLSAALAWRKGSPLQGGRLGGPEWTIGTPRRQTLDFRSHSEQGLCRDRVGSPCDRAISGDGLAVVLSCNQELAFSRERRSTPCVQTSVHGQEMIRDLDLVQDFDFDLSQ